MLKRIVYKWLRAKKIPRYYAIKLSDQIVTEFFNYRFSFKQKMWALRHGFLPSKIISYGLNNKNIGYYVSDFDYYRSYPINKQFQHWINDKLTTYFILKPFSIHLPKIYCLINRTQQIVSIDNQDHIIIKNIEDILQLLHQKNRLALKPNGSSLGAGFFKLECNADQYYLNGVCHSKNDLLLKLSSLKNYLVSEYIVNHKALDKIYDQSTNTVRIMVIQPNEHAVKAVHGYMRFGTSKTGAVDNINAGGISATINMKTGNFSRPKMFLNNSMQDISCHPDTNHPLTGTIPNWEEIKKGVLEIALYLSPLSYMGFDVAVTDDGFKIIEINSHQAISTYQSYEPLYKSPQAGEFFKILCKKSL